MKTDIHPTNYRLVVFQDLNDDTSFLIKSTAETKETIKWQDGKTYPLVKLHVTSASHPFYTGSEKVIDIEGRIDKYKSRQKMAAAAKERLQAKATKAKSPATASKKTSKKDKNSQDSSQTKPSS